MFCLVFFFSFYLVYLEVTLFLITNFFRKNFKKSTWFLSPISTCILIFQNLQFAPPGKIPSLKDWFAPLSNRKQKKTIHHHLSNSRFTITKSKISLHVCRRPTRCLPCRADKHHAKYQDPLPPLSHMRAVWSSNKANSDQSLIMVAMELRLELCSDFGKLHVWIKVGWPWSGLSWMLDHCRHPNVRAGMGCSEQWGWRTLHGDEPLEMMAQTECWQWWLSLAVVAEREEGGGVIKRKAF